MKRATKDPESIYNVQVVTRVLDILETLSGKEEGLRLTELAAEVDLPFSTTHRLVTLMSQRGYVEQDPESRRYFMGLKILQLRGQLLKRLRLVDQALPHMRTLMEKVGELVHLAVLYEGEVAYISSLEGLQAPFMHTPIGYRAPAHCTSLGKAILAHLPEAEVKAIIKKKGLPTFTSSTITSIKKLFSELERIRKVGYAVDDMEQHVGLRCLSAPIFNDSNVVVAAVSIAGPSARVTRQRDAELAQHVTAAAEAISTRLGFVRPAAQTA